MKKEYIIEIDETLIKKFDMALILAEESAEEVLSTYMKKYVAERFAIEAGMMSEQDIRFQQGSDNSKPPCYAKALGKIPKWATKQTQMPFRIIRAFLQIADEKGYAVLSKLEERCSDENAHRDVYVKNFSANFAQMKIDTEKSHGKVFEIQEQGQIQYLCLWEPVKADIMKYKDKFLELRSTDTGYINDWEQKNLGRTNIPGTGFGQMLYQMECGKCGHQYYANGHDVFLKKCPNCQGGADTGNE